MERSDGSYGEPFSAGHYGPIQRSHYERWQWTRDDHLAKQWAPGLLSFDFADQTIPNSSDGGYVRDFTHPGTMINIPNYGSRGILMFLGGGNSNHIRSFNNITIYDKGEKKWYSQVATGDTPRPRAFH